MALRERFSGSDDVIKHRRDFDWLLEAVTKVTNNVSIVLSYIPLSPAGKVGDSAVPGDQTWSVSELSEQ